MNEPIKPLNWKGFPDDTLREHEAWLTDAWSAAVETLAKRDTITRGFMGKALPSPIVRINEADAEAIEATLLDALRTGEIVAYARHPQTNEKHIFDAGKWWLSCAELLAQHKKVPEHMYDDFGPFVNRSLRLDAQQFLVWLHGKSLLRNVNFDSRMLSGFEHVPPFRPYTSKLVDDTAQKEKPIRSSTVAITPPADHTSISILFNRALTKLYPEHSKQADWPQSRTGSGFGWHTHPPSDLLDIWQNRLRYKLVSGAIDKTNYWPSIIWDTAYRLYLAQLTSGVKVYYYAMNVGQAFEVPSELLHPNRDNMSEGSPWSGGEIVNIFGEMPHPELQGAACFIRDNDETKLWNAILNELWDTGAIQEPPPKKRGPRKGGGYVKQDQTFFSELEQLIASNQASSANGAALLIADKLPGYGTPENRAKRLSTLYLKHFRDRQEID